MKCILEIIIFFIKGYIDKDIFEKWIYENEELEGFLGNEFYLDVITVDFSKKEEIIHLKNILKKYLIEEKFVNIDEINDAYCERLFNSSNIEETISELKGTENAIYKLLLEEFSYPIYHEEVSINLTNIKTEKELMRVLCKGLGIYMFPMEWKWFEEYLAESDLPSKIEILGIDNIRKNFGGCYHLIRNILNKVSQDRGAKVQYI